MVRYLFPIKDFRLLINWIFSEGTLICRLQLSVTLFHLTLSFSALHMAFCISEFAFLLVVVFLNPLSWGTELSTHCEIPEPMWNSQDHMKFKQKTTSSKVVGTEELIKALVGTEDLIKALKFWFPIQLLKTNSYGQFAL